MRVFADGNRADRKAQLAKIVADIAARVQHLDIAMAATNDDANVLVKLVRDRDLNRTIATFYGSERAREIRSSLDPQCLSGFRKNEKFEIEHSDVILTVDNGDFVFFDCAYEELLQSLGPINDTSTVPWTMFNDNVSMGYFDVYDQYLLNLLYDPRIKAGMTVQDVKECCRTCSPTCGLGAEGQQFDGVKSPVARRCEFLPQRRALDLQNVTRKGSTSMDGTAVAVSVAAPAAKVSAVNRCAATGIAINPTAIADIDAKTILRERSGAP